MSRWNIVGLLLCGVSCALVAEMKVPEVRAEGAAAADREQLLKRCGAYPAEPVCTAHEPTRGEARPSHNLNTMFALSSGALALTLESSVSFDGPLKPPKTNPSRAYSFEELMEPTFIALREYLADGLERPFLDRGDDRVKPD